MHLFIWNIIIYSQTTSTKLYSFPAFQPYKHYNESHILKKKKQTYYLCLYLIFVTILKPWFVHTENYDEVRKPLKIIKFSFVLLLFYYFSLCQSTLGGKERDQTSNNVTDKNDCYWVKSTHCTTYRCSTNLDRDWVMYVRHFLSCFPC